MERYFSIVMDPMTWTNEFPLKKKLLHRGRQVQGLQLQVTLQQLQNEPSTVIMITQMSTQMSTRISIRMSTWITNRMSSVKNGVNDRETIQ